MATEAEEHVPEKNLMEESQTNVNSSSRLHDNEKGDTLHSSAETITNISEGEILVKTPSDDPAADGEKVNNGQKLDDERKEHITEEVCQDDADVNFKLKENILSTDETQNNQLEISIPEPAKIIQEVAHDDMDAKLSSVVKASEPEAEDDMHEGEAQSDIIEQVFENKDAIAMSESKSSSDESNIDASLAESPEVEIGEDNTLITESHDGIANPKEELSVQVEDNSKENGENNENIENVTDSLETYQVTSNEIVAKENCKTQEGEGDLPIAQERAKEITQESTRMQDLDITSRDDNLQHDDKNSELIVEAHNQKTVHNDLTVVNTPEDTIDKHDDMDNKLTTMVKVLEPEADDDLHEAEAQSETHNNKTEQVLEDKDVNYIPENILPSDESNITTVDVSATESPETEKSLELPAMKIGEVSTVIDASHEEVANPEEENMHKGEDNSKEDGNKCENLEDVTDTLPDTYQVTSNEIINLENVKTQESVGELPIAEERAEETIQKSDEMQLPIITACDSDLQHHDNDNLDQKLQVPEPENLEKNSEVTVEDHNDKPIDENFTKTDVPVDTSEVPETITASISQETTEDDIDKETDEEPMEEQAKAENSNEDPEKCIGEAILETVDENRTNEDSRNVLDTEDGVSCMNQREDDTLSTGDKPKSEETPYCVLEKEKAEDETEYNPKTVSEEITTAEHSVTIDTFNRAKEKDKTVEEDEGKNKDTPETVSQKDEGDLNYVCETPETANTRDDILATVGEKQLEDADMVSEAEPQHKSIEQTDEAEPTKIEESTCDDNFSNLNEETEDETRENENSVNSNEIELVEETVQKKVQDNFTSSLHEEEIQNMNDNKDVIKLLATEDFEEDSQFSSEEHIPNKILGAEATDIGPSAGDSSTNEPLSDFSASQVSEKETTQKPTDPEEANEHTSVINNASEVDDMHAGVSEVVGEKDIQETVEEKRCTEDETTGGTSIYEDKIESEILDKSNELEEESPMPTVDAEIGLDETTAANTSASSIQSIRSEDMPDNPSDVSEQNVKAEISPSEQEYEEMDLPEEQEESFQEKTEVCTTSEDAKTKVATEKENSIQVDAHMEIKGNAEMNEDAQTEEVKDEEKLIKESPDNHAPVLPTLNDPTDEKHEQAIISPLEAEIQQITNAEVKTEADIQKERTDTEMPEDISEKVEPEIVDNDDESAIASVKEEDILENSGAEEHENNLSITNIEDNVDCNTQSELAISERESVEVEQAQNLQNDDHRVTNEASPGSSTESSIEQMSSELENDQKLEVSKNTNDEVQKTEELLDQILEISDSSENGNVKKVETEGEMITGEVEDANLVRTLCEERKELEVEIPTTTFTDQSNKNEEVLDTINTEATIEEVEECKSTTVAQNFVALVETESEKTQLPDNDSTILDPITVEEIIQNQNVNTDKVLDPLPITTELAVEAANTNFDTKQDVLTSKADNSMNDIPTQEVDSEMSSVEDNAEVTVQINPIRLDVSENDQKEPRAEGLNNEETVANSDVDETTDELHNIHDLESSHEGLGKSLVLEEQNNIEELERDHPSVSDTQNNNEMEATLSAEGTDTLAELKDHVEDREVCENVEDTLPDEAKSNDGDSSDSRMQSQGMEGDKLGIVSEEKPERPESESNEVITINEEASDASASQIKNPTKNTEKEESTVTAEVTISNLVSQESCETQMDGSSTVEASLEENMPESASGIISEGQSQNNIAETANETEEVQANKDCVHGEDENEKEVNTDQRTSDKVTVEEAECGQLLHKVPEENEATEMSYGDSNKKRTLDEKIQMDTNKPDRESKTQPEGDESIYISEEIEDVISHQEHKEREVELLVNEPGNTETSEHQVMENADTTILEKDGETSEGIITQIEEVPEASEKLDAANIETDAKEHVQIEGASTVPNNQETAEPKENIESEEDSFRALTIASPQEASLDDNKPESASTILSEGQSQNEPREFDTAETTFPKNETEEVREDRESLQAEVANGEEVNTDQLASETMTINDIKEKESQSLEVEEPFHEVPEENEAKTEENCGDNIAKQNLDDITQMDINKLAVESTTESDEHYKERKSELLDDLSIGEKLVEEPEKTETSDQLMKDAENTILEKDDETSEGTITLNEEIHEATEKLDADTQTDSKEHMELEGTNTMPNSAERVEPKVGLEKNVESEEDSFRALIIASLRERTNTAELHEENLSSKHKEPETNLNPEIVTSLNDEVNVYDSELTQVEPSVTIEKALTTEDEHPLVTLPASLPTQNNEQEVSKQLDNISEEKPQHVEDALNANELETKIQQEKEDITECPTESNKLMSTAGSSAYVSREESYPQLNEEEDKEVLNLDAVKEEQMQQIEHDDLPVSRFLMNHILREEVLPDEACSEETEGNNRDGNDDVKQHDAGVSKLESISSSAEKTSDETSISTDTVSSKELSNIPENEDKTQEKIDTGDKISAKIHVEEMLASLTPEETAVQTSITENIVHDEKESNHLLIAEKKDNEAYVTLEIPAAQDDEETNIHLNESSTIMAVAEDVKNEIPNMSEESTPVLVNDNTEQTMTVTETGIEERMDPTMVQDEVEQKTLKKDVNLSSDVNSYKKSDLLGEGEVTLEDIHKSDESSSALTEGHNPLSKEPTEETDDEVDTKIPKMETEEKKIQQDEEVDQTVNTCIEAPKKDAHHSSAGNTDEENNSLEEGKAIAEDVQQSDRKVNSDEITEVHIQQEKNKPEETTTPAKPEMVNTSPTLSSDENEAVHEDISENAKDENKSEESGQNEGVVQEARDVLLKPAHKKSHNILSGVGSKVKQSIAKVKKAITGKSSHLKTSTATH